MQNLSRSLLTATQRMARRKLLLEGAGYGRHLQSASSVCRKWSGNNFGIETPCHTADCHARTASFTTSSSPFVSAGKKKAKPGKRRKFIPPKAAVVLTPKARKFFKALLENPPRPDIVGVMLNYQQASSGQPRMVFTFDFVAQDQISEHDEGVSLEVLDDGTPKPPKDSMGDGLPKLFVNHNGFMKVLGCTLDVDIENMKPILLDSEGNIRDPNL